MEEILKWRDDLSIWLCGAKRYRVPPDFPRRVETEIYFQPQACFLSNGPLPVLFAAYLLHYSISMVTSYDITNTNQISL